MPNSEASIYDDPDLDHWGPLEFHLYRWLYKSAQVDGVTGIGRVSERQIIFGSRLTADEFKASKAKIGGKVRWYPDGSHWVVGRLYATAYIKHGDNAGKVNPKQAAHLYSKLRDIKAHPQLLKDLASKYPELKTDTLSIPYTIGNLVDPTVIVDVTVTVDDDVDVTEKQRTSAEPSKQAPPDLEIPSELKGLELYAADAKLCKAWPTLYPQMKGTYPNVDVMQKVRELHLWELSNPTKRKVNRARFFANCLAKEQDRPRSPAQPPEPHRFPGVTYVK